MVHMLDEHDEGAGSAPGTVGVVFLFSTFVNSVGAHVPP
jgi:hypothetical protein